MRYSIMLQLVGLITLSLIGAAAFFAWIQNRPVLEQSIESGVRKYERSDYAFGE